MDKTPVSRKHHIVANMISYVPSRYAAQGIGFFTSLFMKRFLGPVAVGIWDLLKVIMQYVDYSELGSTLTVYYKIPLLQGQNKPDEADKIKNIVFSFIMFFSFLAGFGVLVYALSARSHLTKEMFWGLIALTIIIVLDRLYGFLVMLMRAYKDYTALSKAVFFDAVLNLLLVLLLVSKFKLYGLFVAIIVLEIANILYIRFNVRYTLKFKFDWCALWEYVKFGFPMYLNAILTTLLNTVDRLMIAGFLGFEQLGFYSIAMMSKNYSHQLSTNFSHVTSPHFMEDFGKFGNSERIYSYITKGTFSISCFMSVILGGIFIFSYPLVMTILPQFIPGLWPLRIFLVVSFLASLVTFSANFIVTQEKQRMLTVFSVLALLVNIMLNWIFINLHFGIKGVSVATAIASAVYTLGIMWFALKHFIKGKDILIQTVKIFVPFLYVCVVIVVLEKLVTFADYWVCAIIKGIIFLFAVIILFLAFEKETGVLKILFQTLTQGVRAWIKK